MSAADVQRLLQNADALASRGQFPQAEAEYAKARQLAPGDLTAALGHGHVLRVLRRPREAKAVFVQAAALQPGNADVQLGLALSAQESGDAATAETAFRAVLQLQPGAPAAMIGLGDVLNQLQRPDDALALLAQMTLNDANGKAALEQTRGTARLLKQEHDAALAHFDRVLAALPDHPRAGHARAVALQHMGREDEALAAYRKTLAGNPANLGAHRDLNDLLYRLKRDGDFLRSYDEAEKAMPGVPHFAIAKADFLARGGRAGEALALYDRALGLAPGFAPAMQGKAQALLAAGDAGAAITLFEQLLPQAPNDTSLLTALATANLMARDARKAEAAARSALARDPADQLALAALGSAWRLQGDEREHDLNRYDSLVQAIDLEPPPGHSIESFNQALAALLDSRHRDAREHFDQSLRGGTQTAGNIFVDADPLLAALKTSIAQAVAHYIDALPRDERHPFLSRRTDGFAFAGAWSSRLADGGFHDNHLHPGGWISSAYYVALPPEMDGNNQEGWLQFGAPSYDLGFAARRLVQPRAGRLVLFPSYLWHGTVPFRSAQSRTTIAFDAVPQRSRA